MKKIHTNTVRATGATALREVALGMMPLACVSTSSTSISTAAWKRPGTPEVARLAAFHSTKIANSPRAVAQKMESRLM